MYEQRLYRRWWWFAVWAGLAHAAWAQSNQPIFIEPSPVRTLVSKEILPLTGGGSASAGQAAVPARSARPAGSPAPITQDRPSDVSRHGRLGRLAKRLSSAVPASPHGSQTPTVPSPPVSPPSPSAVSVAGVIGQGLGVPSDGSTPASTEGVVMADPKERQALGRATSAEGSLHAQAKSVDPGWMLNTLTALGVVVGIILLLRGGLQRMKGRVAAPVGASVLEVLSRVSIAPRNHVLLMRLGSRVLVVGDSPAGLRTLADIADPEEVASLLASMATAKPNSISAGFSQMVGRFQGAYHDDARVADEGNDTAELHVDRARDRLSSLLSRVRSMASR